MTDLMRAGAVSIAAVALAIGLAACGSEGESAETSSVAATTSETTSEAPADPPTGPDAPAAAMTLDEYIAENNLVRTPVSRGAAGAPTIELPALEGWTEMGPDAPQDAFSALSFGGDPALTTPPATLISRVFRLTGNVDPAKVLEYAPQGLKTLPEFEGPETGQAGQLSGFEAVTIGGLYVREGVPHMVAQKTVTIPGSDGLYVLQIDVEGPEEQAVPLMEATSAIDEQTRIVP